MLDSVIQNDSSKNAGSLVKVGTGTQTLTGSNSYTGSTNINEGTLALAGQGSIAQSASIDIEQQGSFDISKAASDETVNTISGSGSVILGKNTLNIVNANYIKPYSGSISGSGGVNLFRGGVFFSGQNTYTGLTDVKGGDFHLDGSIAGDLLNETTTKIGDQPQGKVSVGGDIKNLGALTIRNATIHNISSDAGASTFLGNVVAEGDISSKSDFVFGDTNKDKDNDVTAFSYNTGKGNRTTLNGNLILTQAHGAINGWVLGGAGLTIAGGTDVLNDYYASTGNLTIKNGGTLEVDGQVSPYIGGLTDVQNGGTLRGTGSLHSLNVQSGGLVAPGTVGSNTPSTLNVAGDVSMAKGSILRINGTSDTTGQSLTTAKGAGYKELTSDRLAVAGKANLAGGTLDLIVKNAGAGLTYGQAYRVLTATQGVSGQFDGLTTNLAAQYAYLDPTLAYSADAVDIVLKRNSTGFGDIGGTHNEVTAGRGVSHVGAGSGLVTALTGLTKDQARRALDNLSGELHASIRTALIQDSFYLRNAVINRLANADCDYGRNGQSVYDLKTHKKNEACYSDHAVLWGQAYGGLGHNSGDGNAALMHHNTAGFIIGADTPINHSHWRVGGLLSYGHSQFNVARGRSSSGNSNNISVGAYAGTHWGRLNLRLGADYSWNVINTRRQIAVGDYGSRVRSSYLGGTAQAYAELGYKLRAGRTVFEPFMNVAYVNMQTNSYREHGNDAALRSRGTDQGVTFSTFGFRAATRVNIGKAVFMPHIMAGYRHGFGRLQPGLHEGFVAGGGTSTMDVAGVLLSSNAAVTDAGITAQITNRINLDLSYIGQYGNHSTESGATGSVNVSF